ALPHVGDDGRAAGRGLEQAHARAVAGADHVGPCDVQRPATGGVESSVIGRADMLDPVDIVRPVDSPRILRSGDDDTAIGRAPRGAGLGRGRYMAGWRARVKVPG